MDNNFLDRLIHGDCFEVLPRLAEAGVTVDAAIADIPYGGETRADWDVAFPLDKMWAYLHSVVKPSGAVVLFGNEPYSSRVRLSNESEYRYDMKWVKNRATGFANANYRPMRRYEDIMVFSQANASAGGKANAMQYYPQGLVEVNIEKTNKKNRKGLIQIGNANVGEDNQLAGETSYVQRFTNYPDNVLFFDCEKRYLHPTQKPLDLMEYLIKTFTKEGECVLDFTMGSGSTCIAASVCGRYFIGIERDEHWFSVAEERYASFKSTPIQEMLF